MTEITARLSTALADRYKIERHLGEGGMATVYLAEDLKHNGAQYEQRRFSDFALASPNRWDSCDRWGAGPASRHDASSYGRRPE